MVSEVKNGNIHEVDNFENGVTPILVARVRLSELSDFDENFWILFGILILKTKEISE